MSFLVVDRSHTKVAHPAVNWAKFYLSRRSHNYEQILGLMTVNELPGLDEGKLQAIEAEMEYPLVFRPHIPTHKASQNFLKKHGIWDAWARRAPMEQALSILENKRLRDIVETLMLSPIKPALAIRKIEDEEGITIQPRAYDLFRHYFWNTSVMSGADWGQFIQDRRSTHQEWLELSMNTRGASGVQALLWRMGYGGLRQVEANKGFSDVRDVAFMCIQQIAMDPPSKRHSETLLNYLKVAKLSQEGVDASSAAVKDVVESFQAFRMRNVETKAPSITQLTKGNFSPAEQVDGDEEELKY